MHIDSAPQDGPVILGTATRLSHHYAITLSIVSTSYAWWWQMRCVIVLGLTGSEPLTLSTAVFIVNHFNRMRVFAFIPTPRRGPLLCSKIGGEPFSWPGFHPIHLNLALDSMTRGRLASLSLRQVGRVTKLRPFFLRRASPGKYGGTLSLCDHRWIPWVPLVQMIPHRTYGLKLALILAFL